MIRQKLLLAGLVTLLCYLPAFGLEQSFSNMTMTEFTVDSTLRASSAGCNACMIRGDCQHAFHGAPGKFCKTVGSGSPCCCPADAECVYNTYDCRCRRAAYHQGYPHSQASHSSSMSWILPVLLLACCLCCCCSNRESHHGDHHGYEHVHEHGRGDAGVPYAQPMYPAQQYGTAPPQGYYGPQQSTPGYAQPSAPPMYEQRGTGNSWAAGATGAVGGLATGMLLDSAMRGDWGRQEPTTQEFAGDTGDFMGDMGDTGDMGDMDGDFDGDS